MSCSASVEETSGTSLENDSGSGRDIDDSDEACWCMKVPLARPETCPMRLTIQCHCSMWLSASNSECMPNNIASDPPKLHTV